MLARTAADLGLLVRERRRALGLDQRALAELVGVSRLWVIEFERGKPRAEVGLVLRTLTALGLELDVRSGDDDANAGAPSDGRVDVDAIVRAARKARK